MKCKHYKGTGVTYKIPQELNLCDECNFNLIKQVFSQLVLEQQLTLLERLKK